MSEIKVYFEGMKKHKELVRAWLDGATIQVKALDTWHDCSANEPLWHPDEVYRIKPEPKYVPFDFSEQLVGKIIREKESGKRYEILAQLDEFAFIVNDYIDYGQLLERYEFLSGSPCGKLEEQE